MGMFFNRTIDDVEKSAKQRIRIGVAEASSIPYLHTLVLFDRSDSTIRRWLRKHNKRPYRLWQWGELRLSYKALLLLMEEHEVVNWYVLNGRKQ